MNIEGYIEFVRDRLAPVNLHGLLDYFGFNSPEPDSSNEIEKPIIQAITNDIELAHCALGLAGEALELSLATDIPNELEEIGDILFYTVATDITACKMFGLTGETVLRAKHTLDFAESPVEPYKYRGLCLWCEEVSNLCKKIVFYQQKKLKDGEDISVALFEGLFRVYRNIHSHHHLSDVLEANVSKLSKRYEKKFTPEEAAERKDKE